MKKIYFYYQFCFFFAISETFFEGSKPTLLILEFEKFFKKVPSFDPISINFEFGCNNPLIIFEYFLGHFCAFSSGRNFEYLWADGKWQDRVIGNNNGIKQRLSRRNLSRR